MNTNSPTKCFVDQTSYSFTTATPPHHAGCKRPRAHLTTTTLALYDPSTSDQQRSTDEAIAQAHAGALVPFTGEPINAVPLSSVPPKKLAPVSVRAEPPWLRMGLLLYLKLRCDLPVYFIDEKVITATDLDRQQNRFRLPSEGVLRNLRPVLTLEERVAANLLHEEAPRLPRLPKMPKLPGEKTTKRKGKKHGGLPVLVVEPYSGIGELQLSRWDSSGGTVIKGEGYLDFIKDSGFKAGDVVEIWAFKETYFRLFGNDVCHDGPLHLLITKIGQIPRLVRRGNSKETHLN